MSARILVGFAVLIFVLLQAGHINAHPSSPADSSPHAGSLKP